MATLATHFRTALSRIEPGDDATNGKEAHHQVSAALTADTRLQGLGVSPVLIGSYGRNVSIRRVKDVDVFVRLQDATSSLRPGDILDHVTDVLQLAFPGCVARQHRSVKVDFAEYDLSVDAVIARPCVDHPTEHWQIPQKIEADGRASWIKTNPTRMGELTTAANKQYLLSAGDPGSGVYVPLVKLIRQVRRVWVADQPGGYYFEVLTYHALRDLQPNQTTVAGYLSVVLREIADRLPDHLGGAGPADPTMDGRVITTRATDAQISAAADRLAQAADLAQKALRQTDQCRSAVLWRRLLGCTQNVEKPEDVFPLPEYCNADGTTKSSTTTLKGAPAVPAGSDRYA